MGRDGGARRRARLIGLCVLAIFGVLASASPAAMADAQGSQFRVSFQGHDGDTTYSAQQPDIAFDPSTRHHLVVFYNRNGTTASGTISGQFLDSSGNRVGGNFPISPVGVSREPPAVAYDAADHQFLVVWYTSSGSFQIVQAQRVSSSGALLGSTIAVSATTTYKDVETVDVAWSPDAGEFLVGWKAFNKGQIYGRRISTGGVPLGTSDLQISHVTAGSTTGADDAMAVAYNTRDHEFLVAWRGQDSVQAPNSEYEIWGQRVATNGSNVGPSDFQISHFGSLPDHSYQRAARPNIAYDPTRNRYLVVFMMDTTPGPNTHPSTVVVQVFGQLVAANGSLVGGNFQISHFAGAPNSGAVGTDVAYDPTSDLYMAVYAGTPNDETGEPPKSAEIYGDYLNGNGALVGNHDFQISNMGSSTNPLLGGFRPAIDTSSDTHQFMTVWQGDTTQGSLVDNQLEVWGRAASSPAPRLVLKGRLKPSRKGVTFSVTCQALSSTATCRGNARLSTLEHLRGHKVKGLTARKHKRGKRHKKRVVIGSKKSFSLLAGKTIKVTVPLNRKGKRLLKRFHRVPATLKISLLNTNPPTVLSKKTTIKQKKKKKKHH